MDVIRHHDKGMQDIVMERLGAVLDSAHNHLGHRGYAQIGSAGTSLVQHSIERVVRFSGIDGRGRESAMRREAVVEPPRNEERSTGS